MGVYLLSTVAARDLGWIGTLDMVDRLGATLTTMAELERFRGHFYNWYDTQTLKPLEPRYVSSVDSGNLAGHLSVLAVAAREYGRQPLVGVDVLRGVEAVLLVLAEALPAGETPSAGAAALRATVDELRGLLVDEPATTIAWAGRLRELEAATQRLVDRARGLDASTDGHALVWAEAARATLANHRRDLDALAPWIDGLVDMSRILFAGDRTDMGAVARLLGTPIDLANLPEAARAAARELDGRLTRPGARASGSPLDAGAVAKLVEALERSALAGRGAAATARDRGSRRPRPVRGDGLRLPFRRTPSALRHRLPGRRRIPRRGAVRPAGLGGAAHELRGDRAGRGARRALVPAGAADDPRRVGHRARFVVRLDVRVPDARARHAHARRKRSRPDLPPRGQAPDDLRARPGRAVGCLGVGLQRAGSRPDLSILELRRARARARARDWATTW